MLDYLKNDQIVEHIYLINNFFKIMRNKRYFFCDENVERRMNNVFLGKRRETSNSISELTRLSTYFKDKIILNDKTIFLDGGNKYFCTKEEIKNKISFICN